MVAADNGTASSGMRLPGKSQRASGTAFDTARRLHSAWSGIDAQPAQDFRMLVGAPVALSGPRPPEPVRLPPAPAPLPDPEPSFSPYPMNSLPVVTTSVAPAAMSPGSANYGFPTTSMPRNWRSFFPSGSVPGEETAPVLKQRQALSRLEQRDRDALTLWALQLTCHGYQDGGIYFNVLMEPDNFTPGQLELAGELSEEETAAYGGFTGVMLDRWFFKLYRAITGTDLEERYAQRAVRLAAGPIDLSRVERRLSSLERAVLRVWGNLPLFNDGQVQVDRTGHAGLNKRDAHQLVFWELAEGSEALEPVLLSALDRLYRGSSRQENAGWSDMVVRAVEARPCLTGFPAGGDPIRYKFMVRQLETELAAFDAELAEVARLARVEFEPGYLDGSLEVALFLRQPADHGEYASFLKAQLAGGRVAFFQRDAVPGSRLALVDDPTLFHAAVARMYAYQFAAYALGAYPFSPQGIEQGAQAFGRMSPDARVFAQVASVYMGSLLGGPALYNKDLLRELLERRGLEAMTYLPGVGQTDLETLGTMTAAFNEGSISFNDFLSSGAVADLARFRQALTYVVDGTFNYDLGRYDAVPLKTPKKTTARAILSNPHAGRLGSLKAMPLVAGYYALFDLDGDGEVVGHDARAMVSFLSDYLNLMLSGARPGANAPAAVRLQHYFHDFNRDGVYSLAEVRQFLEDLAPVLEAAKLDQFGHGARGEVKYGPPCVTDPALTRRISRCPVVGRLAGFEPLGD